jgi:hypothetical protein
MASYSSSVTGLDFWELSSGIRSPPWGEVYECPKVARITLDSNDLWSRLVLRTLNGEMLTPCWPSNQKPPATSSSGTGNDDEWEPASDPVGDAGLDLELVTPDPERGQSSGQSELAVFITELPIDH